ncbi:MAG: 3-phosphoshikimate 1-carboxyvinyltransferase [Flavobacteriales bacterium]|nr:3-phosphoshikimate 1-carboxyvinyltransferase [Flavobacteriales bacterium]
MKAKIQIADKKIKGTLQLTGSKSISNRLLILQALSGQMSPLKNLSNSDDTMVLQKALSSKDVTVDVGIAGTAMRFLTAYYAIQDSETILTGASRMKERPIKDLVDALRSLGAEVDYMEKEGFPPLKIKGKKLQGGKLSIKADVSSQFISAILMISPYFEKGIQLELVGEVLSRPYIEMTLNLMQQQGVGHKWEGNTISILPGVYYDNVREVESDWSSISYIFELVALSDSGEISLTQVEEVSVQGDQEGMNYFQLLGVDSSIENGVLTLSKKPDFELPEYLEFDCTKTPDLAQTLTATACALGIRMKITGLKSLPIKETDRLMALKTELEKCGAEVHIINNEALELIPGTEFSTKDFNFETYGDHRMALCLAPLALKSHSVTVDNPAVVNKSYKSYWEDLKSMLFDIHSF